MRTSCFAPDPAHLDHLGDDPFERPAPSPLYAALDREWHRLRTDPDALSRVRGWELDAPRTGGRLAPTSLDDLLLLTGYGAVGTYDDAANDLLCRLVDLAHTDPLAARIVFQRIAPGLCTLPWGWRVPGASWAAVDDEIVGTAWTVIRTFPVATRGQWVAAQLVRDVRYRVFKLPARRLATFVPVPDTSFADSAEPPVEVSPREELEELLTGAHRAGATPEDLGLLRRLGSGTTTAELAREQSVSERMIRYRRSAAIERVRALALSSC